MACEKREVNAVPHCKAEAQLQCHAVRQSEYINNYSVLGIRTLEEIIDCWYISLIERIV